MSSIASLTVTFLFISSCLSVEIPSFVPRCCQEDPKLGECFIKGTEDLRQYTKTGHKALGIPPISPLFIQEIKFEQLTESLDVNVLLKNATVTGLDTYEFTEFTYDPKNYTFHGHVKVGALTVVSKIDFSGEVFDVKLSGTGEVSGTSDPTEATFNVYGKIVKKDGEDFFEVTDGNTQVKKLGGKIHFANFQSDNNELVAALNDVINSNAQVLIRQLRGPIETLAKTTILEIVNGLAGTVPYNVVFPHCKKE
ncbi:hypothetical protein ILUMI_26615 [Ignelater luminosus]|uniref:Uncharacterized protein n=1 Tax=Ignelater luminosus TaxID=2038154 RepID=A0A8K0FYY8_IGNLU|nr:hypothetical protein ILUMI_26615 [Ignelater luminosus]